MSDRPPRYVHYTLGFVAAAIAVSVLMALDSPLGNYIWMTLALVIASVSGEHKAVAKCP